jgi:hypothetical protein
MSRAICSGTGPIEDDQQRRQQRRWQYGKLSGEQATQLELQHESQACSSVRSAACAPATPVAIPVVAIPAPATTTAALLLAFTAASASSPGDCQLSAWSQWLPRSRGLPQGAPAEGAAETVDAGRCWPAGPGSLHVPAGQPAGLHGQHHRQPVAPWDVQAADRSASCRTMLASRVYHTRTTMMF